ncbi:hypothetical protein G6F40_016214 [Rhizopus arrhizus]|nr:hypothetical protein G6F40_016214 [Rhizopus arrhizus]
MSPLGAASGGTPIPASTPSKGCGSMPWPAALKLTLSAPSSARSAPSTESALGKSALLFSVPCQVSDQPPDWSPMLSAPLPTTSTRASLRNGSAWPSFFSSTSDSRTARRASSRCCTAVASPA